ncbi:MAG TPA: DUF3311 domain-containing protein [Acidiphilium sp.]
MAVFPCVGVILGPIVHNKVHPLILGMPFPLGWITVWIVIAAICMAIVYALDPVNKVAAPDEENQA